MHPEKMFFNKTVESLNPYLENLGPVPIPNPHLSAFVKKTRFSYTCENVSSSRVESIGDPRQEISAHNTSYGLFDNSRVVKNIRGLDPQLILTD